MYRPIIIIILIEYGQTTTVNEFHHASAFHLSMKHTEFDINK